MDIGSAAVAGDTLQVEVSVRNLTGHKLPTGYPARRVWLHLTVATAGRDVVFESGPVAPTGAIGGNDGDATATDYDAMAAGSSTALASRHAIVR